MATGADAWLRSIEQALRSRLRPAAARTTMVFTTDTVSLQTLQEFAADSAFVEETLQLFVNTMLLGPRGGEWSFHYQFHARANNARRYSPVFKSKEDALNIADRFSDSDSFDRATTNGANIEAMRRKAKVRMSQGFEALWNVFSKPVPVRKSGDDRFSFGVGQLSLLDQLKLADYMPITGSRKGGEFNSLFKAVEFGTGIAANVGGARWVRLDGPTKDRTRNDGSWWLGKAEGQGVRVEGQRGFHFLYDAATREPHRGYVEYFRREFPRFFLSRIVQRLNGG